MYDTGLGTTFQAVPFQCATSSPTDQALVGDRSRTALIVIRTGVGTAVQVLPLKCSVIGPDRASPTIQTSRAEEALMPDGMIASKREGLGATFQELPFQCSMNWIGSLRPW